MTKQEAKEAMMAGDKVTHDYFSEGEYAYYNEHGQLLTEDGVDQGPDFWNIRTGEQWETGWSIYAVKKLMERNPDTHQNCELLIKESDYARPVNIDTVFNNYAISDFKLVGYTSDEEIKVEMLAPKE